MRFTGRIALVTGSSEGIGLEVARRLAAEGAQVVLNGRDARRLRQAAPRCEAAGSRPPLAVPADVSRPAEAARLVRTVLRHFGRLDVLVNNAGGSTNTKAFRSLTPADWNRTMAVNLAAAGWVTQAALPAMLRQGRGRIVNVSSFAARSRSRLSGPDYAAAKAGVLGLTRQLAHELGPSGIAVNAVTPGITLTDRVRRLWLARPPAERRRVLEGIPLRRLAEPGEVASVIVFLASDEASYLTGVTLDVNGGTFMV